MMTLTNIISTQFGSCFVQKSLILSFVLGAQYWPSLCAIISSPVDAPQWLPMYNFALTAYLLKKY
jgi:hypothetical protein